jgi:uncharacterized protein (DUF885 family)
MKRALARRVDSAGPRCLPELLAAPGTDERKTSRGHGHAAPMPSSRGALALAPVTATQAGYHTHDGAALDEQIDDFSAAGIDAQRRFYQDMQRRVSALETAGLDREQQADVQIITNSIGLSLLELDYDSRRFGTTRRSTLSSPAMRCMCPTS